MIDEWFSKYGGREMRLANFSIYQIQKMNHAREERLLVDRPEGISVIQMIINH